MVNSLKISRFLKVTLFGFLALQVNSLSAATNSKILIFDGLAQYADRLEIVPSDDCSSFEIRSWGRVVDKKTNLLCLDRASKRKFKLHTTVFE